MPTLSELFLSSLGASPHLCPADIVKELQQRPGALFIMIDAVRARRVCCAQCSLEVQQNK